MGLLDWIRRRVSPQQATQPTYPGPVVPHVPQPPEPAPAPTPEIQPDPEPTPQNDLAPEGWFMPQYRDRDICDWIGDIADLKREGRLEEALELATGCMHAMVAAAEINPANVMEYYVIQVGIIQRKLKDYASEVEMLTDWLGRDLPAPRDDYRLEIRKRLAKAQALHAKAEGRDPSAFNAEWKRLVELSKKSKEPKAVEHASSGISTGRSLAHPKPRSSTSRPARRSGSRFVPSPAELLTPTFVAVDFETANRYSGASACQIALVKVHNGMIVERYSTLLKPPQELSYFEFTDLHGISARKVKRAPMWPHIAGDVSRFVSGLPVYAHNASFDAGVWRDLDVYFNTTSLPEPFFCTYRTARQIIPGLENYKLPTVVNACVPRYRLRHHKADSDAEACAFIVMSFQSLVANGGAF
ncbi:3'-5' exonuclease [Corynebacterium uropygiale]|uniref:3'-5' exonuclease n=1 Tax=Corynebacterium uropygiale TaxID=1775911 RepID=A0A9X1QMY2_9CORY|nr:3'-5' exonuclease [Corynebacterium uropygiale]MCF4005596.1 3'-5' exonuclease [Corynebacterium uropygiale]